MRDARHFRPPQRSTDLRDLRRADADAEADAARPTVIVTAILAVVLLIVWAMTQMH